MPLFPKVLVILRFGPQRLDFFSNSPHHLQANQGQSGDEFRLLGQSLPAPTASSAHVGVFGNTVRYESGGERRKGGGGGEERGLIFEPPRLQCSTAIHPLIHSPGRLNDDAGANGNAAAALNSSVVWLLKEACDIAKGTSVVLVSGSEESVGHSSQLAPNPACCLPYPRSVPRWGLR